MRHEYEAKVEWQRGDQDFLKNKYSRVHTWTFDGGTVVPACASPKVIPPPLSSEEAVDPEEALVASVSSCHMLWFLALAGKKKLVVESYQDNAVGILEKDSDGKTAITEVILKPNIVFGGDEGPDKELLDELHEQAHDLCFIANSLKSEVRVEPVS